MALNPLTTALIAFILGWCNLLGLLLVLLSCRCILKINPQMLARSKLYTTFYKYHCYYWWFFIASVVFHATLAIYSYGIPK
jgi:hypothetical protein